MTRKIFGIFTVAVISLLMAGCQSTSNSAVGIKVEDAWARPAPADAMMGAFYMVVRNDGETPDTLTGASAAACGAVEFHESVMSQDNVMSMHPVEGGRIEIPAAGKVELKPGGLHMMCVHKQIAFEPGEKIPLKLTFAHSGELEIEVEIREP